VDRGGGGGEPAKKEAENGTRRGSYGVRLGLKIARRRCRSVRDAMSGIEIMLLRLPCLNIRTRRTAINYLVLISNIGKRGDLLIHEFIRIYRRAIACSILKFYIPNRNTERRVNY